MINYREMATNLVSRYSGRMVTNHQGDSYKDSDGNPLRFCFKDGAIEAGVAAAEHALASGSSEYAAGAKLDYVVLHEYRVTEVADRENLRTS
jgi:hypothetical protein